MVRRPVSYHALTYVGKEASQRYAPELKVTVGLHCIVRDRATVSSLGQETGSTKRTPRNGEQQYTYLVTEDRDTNVPFLVDPRVIDLRREFHLHRR